MLSSVVPMIHVPDVRAAAQWYQEIGFDLVAVHEEDGYMDWAMLVLGVTRLMFNEGGRSSTEDRREVDLYVYTSDVDALYRQLKDRVEIRETPHDTRYGHRECIVRDLNGFWITFGQPQS